MLRIGHRPVVLLSRWVTGSWGLGGMAAGERESVEIMNYEDGIPDGKDDGLALDIGIC